MLCPWMSRSAPCLLILLYSFHSSCWVWVAVVLLLYQSSHSSQFPLSHFLFFLLNLHFNEITLLQVILLSAFGVSFAIFLHNFCFTNLCFSYILLTCKTEDQCSCQISMIRCQICAEKDCFNDSHSPLKASSFFVLLFLPFLPISFLLSLSFLSLYMIFQSFLCNWAKLDVTPCYSDWGLCSLSTFLLPAPLPSSLVLLFLCWPCPLSFFSLPTLLYLMMWILSSLKFSFSFLHWKLIDNSPTIRYFAATNSNSCR